jgi:hypothetical protein
VWVLSAAGMRMGRFAEGYSRCWAAGFDLIHVHIETVCAGREVCV